jgi:hypothetical protein
MKVALSDFDRLLVSSAQRHTPWIGGEENLVLRYEIGNALRISDFEKSHGEIPAEKLSRKPSFTASLRPDQVELLIEILSCAGGTINPEVARDLGELVVRLRRLVPRKGPPK